MKNLFDLNHLKSLHTGYWKHFIFGMQCNFLAFLAFITGMIHTIFPPLFPFLPAILIDKIAKKMEKYQNKT